MTAAVPASTCAGTTIGQCTSRSVDRQADGIRCFCRTRTFAEWFRSPLVPERHAWGHPGEGGVACNPQAGSDEYVAVEIFLPKQRLIAPVS